jgi:putative heme-binding domain-containing protein
MTLPARAFRTALLSLLGSALPLAAATPPAKPALSEDYNQWKEALRAAATPATNISAPRGFVVELVRAARPDEGSWVSFAFDPRGRVVVAREDRGLLRLDLSTNAAASRAELFATNLLECRGLLFAFDALYANANNSKGLYRLRDTDGDDRFDEINLLRSTAGGVGHGRNDLVLGPDNFIYSIHGDDVRVPEEGASGSSPFRALAPAGLLPCAWETHLYGGGVTPPGGHVVRTDRDGKRWEILAAGLRNPFGIDFNPDGDLFTYDADLEWDIGLPWYHPTRVLHLVPGADYGWRLHTTTLSAWLPDTRPAVVDIGKGSPTAVRFGTRSSFPPAYRRALFILDWAYGRILAIHLTPRGASYTGRAETFLHGRPLNVTDIDFGPDGALYFVTGGRRTQSGLYRVRYTGPTVEEPAPPASALADERACAELRALRRQLESFAAGDTTNALSLAWPHLAHDDEWIRHAARVAVERRPVGEWQERALAEGPSAAAATALLALARVGPKDVAERLFARLLTLPLDSAAGDVKLAALRAFEVAFIRWGKPPASVVDTITARLEAGFPSSDARVNQQACTLLVFLGSSNVVGKTMPLLATATTQEEKLHYLHTLRLATNGWTLDQRRACFEALRRAIEFPGAHYLPLVLKYIHADAVASVSEPERAALGTALAPPEPAAAAVVAVDPNRHFVQAWQPADLAPAFSEISPRRDLRRGRALYVEAGCRQCHPFAGEGIPVGPDLTGVAGRFSPKDLLESILEPSRVIAENYRNVTVTTRSGAIMDGRLIAEDEERLTLATNPIDPDNRWTVRKRDIASKRVSDVSPMPSGLLDNFSKEEILDLLAFLTFGADGAAVQQKASESLPTREP